MAYPILSHPFTHLLEYVRAVCMDSLRQFRKVIEVRATYQPVDNVECELAVLGQKLHSEEHI